MNKLSERNNWKTVIKRVDVHKHTKTSTTQYQYLVKDAVLSESLVKDAAFSESVNNKSLIGLFISLIQYQY
jgi:hypothetical protein